MKPPALLLQKPISATIAMPDSANPAEWGCWPGTGMMAQKSMGVRAAFVLAFGTFVISAVSSAALMFPHSSLGRVVNLAPVHEARAQALLTTAPVSEANLSDAAAETRKSLESSPANATAWLRIAYLDRQKGTGLSAVGRDALARSYALSPYGPSETPWRLRFAFNNWSRIGAPLRALALEEVRITERYAPGSLGIMAQDIQDPAGHMALKLVMLSAF